MKPATAYGKDKRLSAYSSFAAPSSTEQQFVLGCSKRMPDSQTGFVCRSTNVKLSMHAYKRRVKVELVARSGSDGYAFGCSAVLL